MNSESELLNYYKILNIPETATADEIKKSYRTLSMMHHPDRNPNDPNSTRRFQEIGEAYEVLSDPKQRKLYDLKRNNPIFHALHHGTKGPAGDASAEGFAPHFINVLNNLFSGQGSQCQKDEEFIFNSLFNRGTHTHGHGSMSSNERDRERPSPLTTTLVVSYENMYLGALMPIEIERWFMEDGVKKYETEILYVSVPKGVDENEIIMIPNKGNSMSDTCKGDVKVFIKLDNTMSPEFKRHGIDLVFEKEISLKDALCGFSFAIKHLNGTNYTINNFGRIIHPGHVKKIPQLGIKRDEHVGNLVILFKISFPNSLDETTVAQLKEIEF